MLCVKVAKFSLLVIEKKPRLLTIIELILFTKCQIYIATITHGLEALSNISYYPEHLEC